LKNIEIAGKTGTAQVYSIKKDDKRESKDLKYSLRDHAWFVCYAPAKNPVIAISVLIEHGEHGSSTAAPIASALIEQYIQGSFKEKILPE
ncbi:MAG: penicillin-binding protein 2, partial [Proteobacteria bacterium]|nr:penicillin-binding protein 2 [Pseudomonadota bacterium]